MQAWTQPGPFAFEGKYYHFEYVNTWPRPVQQPHPPIWIPSQGSRETIEWAAHPGPQVHLLADLQPGRGARALHGRCTRQAAKYGYQATAEQLGWSMPVYAAETDEIARREAQARTSRLSSTSSCACRSRCCCRPATSRCSRSWASMRRQARRAAAKQTIDDLIEQGMFICGSAATLREQIERYQKEIGFG